MLLPVAALAALGLVAASVPGLCVGTCEVPGTGLGGFIPPVVVVQSGSTVVWSSFDLFPHLNEEGLVTSGPEGCFRAGYSRVSDGPVTFTLDGGLLLADDGTGDKPCATAEPLAAGAMLLGYQCTYHPLQMKGELVVVP
jgi:plastocyanin